MESKMTHEEAEELGLLRAEEDKRESLAELRMQVVELHDAAHKHREILRDEWIASEVRNPGAEPYWVVCTVEDEVVAGLLTEQIARRIVWEHNTITAIARGF